MSPVTTETLMFEGIHFVYYITNSFPWFYQVHTTPSRSPHPIFKHNTRFIPYLYSYSQEYLGFQLMHMQINKESMQFLPYLAPI